MTPEQFTYWLQGFAEMNDGKPPSKEQWRMIKDHLQLCFNKVTPSLEQYRQFNPIQPPFKVTCTGYPTFYGESGGRIGAYINADGSYQGSGGGQPPKGGGGGC